MFKKLDIFVLKAYAMLFGGTACISLFVFMMQFLWKWVDELIGKGLSTFVVVKFFYLAALTLVPIALPLGVLLASLITFGNMGEQLELLSMKAAGIPLRRILRPIVLFNICVFAVSFYFQNSISPEASKQLAAFIWTMRQKSPELEIPEVVFYNNIPNYNIFVQRKDKERGVLYGVMIYSTAGGYDDAQIVLADSGRLQSTPDKCHLRLTLWNGERFKNMQNEGGMSNRVNVPYSRETFIEEVDIIAFGSGFNLLSADMFGANAQTKRLSVLRQATDSLNHLIDSIGRSIYQMQQNTTLNRLGRLRGEDSLQAVAAAARVAPFDSLMAPLSRAERQRMYQSAQSKARMARSEYEFRGMVATDNDYQLRRHIMEMHKKFTLSFACLVFFFIGAPFGAIIRKGGLGLPVVVSVLIFIFYYIINAAGEKLAKTGSWDPVFGIWFSTIILVPIAAWLTHKANGDSNLFNKEAYFLALDRLKYRFIGIRNKYLHRNG